MRWAPAAGAAGYRVLVREAAQPFGAGSDVGAVAPASDGSLRHVVSGLVSGAAYAFAVSAYDAAGSSSALSNELTLQVAATPTTTASATASPTRSATASATLTRTASATRTRTASRTATFTPTSPPSPTVTPSATASATASPTPTPTATPQPAREVALPSGLRAPPGSELLLPLTLDAGTAVRRLQLRIDADPSVVALDDAALIDPNAGTLIVTRDASGLQLDVVLAAPHGAAAALLTVRAVAVGACAESSALRLTTCSLDDGAVACRPHDGAVVLRCGVAGRIRHWASGAPVRAATVRLDGAQPAETSTDALGQFAFTAMDSGAVRLAPAKQGDLGAALSALDAALVLRAAAGVGRLDGLQTLACDATGNGTISALDAARILQVAVGQRARLPVADACGSDWAFVPTDSGASAPPIADGACRGGAVELELAGDAPPAQDFLAVPLGDCSGNWSGGGAALRRGNAARVWLGPPRPRPGGTWSVALYARSDAAVMAVDARLIAVGDAALRLTAVRPVGAARAAALHHAVVDDRIALASASATPWTADGRPIAALLFAAGPRPVVRLRGAVVDEIPARLGE